MGIVSFIKTIGKAIVAGSAMSHGYAEAKTPQAVKVTASNSDTLINEVYQWCYNSIEVAQKQNLCATAHSDGVAEYKRFTNMVSVAIEVVSLGGSDKEYWLLFDCEEVQDSESLCFLTRNIESMQELSRHTIYKMA